jgi:integrin alpha FG-GAP repeat containing protein 1
MDTTFSPSIPTPPRLADINLDGFPDLVFIWGTAQDSARTVSTVLSEPCGKGAAGCANGATHGWRELKKDVDVLRNVQDASGVALWDMDEDVRLTGPPLLREV